MGSFCVTEGSGTSVPRATPSFFCSSRLVKDKGSSEESSLTRRSVPSFTKECARSGQSSSRLGVLFTSLSCSEKEYRENETGVRFVLPESVSGGSTFQDGNQQINQVFYSHGNVDYLSRSDRCVFPHSHCSSLSQISQVGLGRQSLCFQGNAFRPIYSSAGFHKHFPSCSGSSSCPIYFYPLVSGRFSDQEQLYFSSRSAHSFSHPSTAEFGFPYFMEKVRNSSQPEFHFPGRAFSDRSGNSSSSGREVFETQRPFASVSQFQASVSTPISSVDWFSDFSHGYCSFGPSSCPSLTVVSSGILGASLSTLGGSHSNSSQSLSTSPVVVEWGQCPKGLSSRSTDSFNDFVYRRIPDRLGSYPRRQVCVRSVVPSSARRTHKPFRNESCSASFETFPSFSSRSGSDDSYRQYDSCSLSSEPGRNAFSLSLSSLQRNPIALSSFRHSFVSEACARQSECNSRCPVQVCSASEYRVGVTSSSVSGDLLYMGSSPLRSVCHAAELQTSNLCVPSSRQQSLCSRRNVNQLERDVLLHVSPLSSSSKNSLQDSNRFLQEHSYCSSVAKTVVVPRSSPSLLCETSSSSPQGRSVVSVQGQKTSSGSTQSSSSRLVIVGESLRKEGFSERAARRISSSVRKSTGAIYDSKWSIFCSWCRSREIDPVSVSVQQLADFFVYLFEDKGYSPSTIKGYRSALSRTISLLGGPDFGKNEVLSRMIKNFGLERPRQRRLVPSWNLALVLKSLQFPPYEPLSTTSFKFLTFKCCFLLALASGRRRSEIHALSVADSCIRFAADKSSVTLLTDPSFLAKNQLSDKGSGPIFIPALPASAGNQDLCPVRTLLKYLSISAPLRPPGSSRLFIPIKKGLVDISAKTISSWLCQTVKFAYLSSPQDVLASLQVRAHEIRALSCSWAIFNSSSMSEIMSAGFWRSDNSFYNYYLRSMPLHSDNLYSLGPLVSAQRVVFPPRSQGDSALL